MRPSRIFTAGIAALAFGMLTAGMAGADLDTADRHLATFVKLEGTYTQTHATTWDTVAKYADYADLDQRGSEDAHNAGIKVGFYTDVHLLCKGNTCSGSPNVEDVPEAAFAHTCDGRRVYSSDDTDAARKLLGDPRSPALKRALNRVIDGKLHNQFGNYHEDFVIDDDVFIPEATWFAWHADSPRGPVQQQPYCGYTRAAYMNGIKAIEAAAHVPVLFNGLNGLPDVPYIENAPNVIGGICEDCLHASYDAARNREGSPIWNEELDAALSAVDHKKVWVDYPHGEIDDDTQGYLYASLMLVSHRGSIVLHEDIDTPSGLSIPPTVWLVPHGSLAPMPHRIAQLRRPGGTYAREFAHCAIDGTPVGPCAAIVNPDANASHAYPFPAGRYRRILQISGRGIARDLGDTGRLTLHTAAPPPAIGPRGWAIVFR